MLNLGCPAVQIIIIIITILKTLLEYCGCNKQRPYRIPKLQMFEQSENGNLDTENIRSLNMAAVMQ
jgi:hypothetical protein